LVQKHGHIRQDQGDVDDGKGSAGVEILERDEHSIVSWGRVTKTQRNEKAGKRTTRERPIMRAYFVAWLTESGIAGMPHDSWRNSTT
jgi:hypothetical protein